MFAENEDFQMVTVDVWNGPPNLVWSFYAGCSDDSCNVSPPFLLYGGLNGVNEEYCMPAPSTDSGYLVIDKCGIVRLNVFYLDFTANQQALIDTIAAYLAPPPAPERLVVTPADGGVQLYWNATRPCNGGYDIFSSSTPDFEDEFYLGHYEEPEAFLTETATRDFYRVVTVYP